MNELANKFEQNAPVILMQKDASGKLGRFSYLPKGDEVGFNLNGDNYSVSIHGAGWVRNRIVTSGKDFIEISRGIDPRNIPESVGAKQRGSLCTYLMRHGTIFILPDPLGGCILFRYNSKNLVAYSSDLAALIKAVKDTGETPTKNLNYVIELVATGNGGFNSSSYNDVVALEQFEFVEINQNRVSIKSYGLASAFFQPLASYEYAFESSRDELLGNAEAVLQETGRNKIAHLTGGFDSRLVLAALVGAGLNKDEFKFNCSGHIDLPDKFISTQLCGHLGLTMTNSVGSIKKKNELGNSLYRTEGLIKFDPPHSALRNHLLLAGGYGECFRSFYANRYDLQADTKIENLLASLHGSKFSQDGDRLISDSFYEDYKVKVSAFIADSIKKGIRRDAVLDYMYVAKRNRYFVGLISNFQSNTSPRVDPLYSISGIRAALQLPRRERVANITGLDLMRSFSEELAALPFDSERISPEYEAMRGTISRLQFNGSRPKMLNEAVMEGEINSIAATPKHIAKAKALRATLWQVVYMEPIQKEIQAFINSGNKRSIANVFNLKMINRLTTRDLNNRAHLRSLYSVYDVLKWYCADSE